METKRHLILILIVCLVFFSMTNEGATQDTEMLSAVKIAYYNAAPANTFTFVHKDAKYYVCVAEAFLEGPNPKEILESRKIACARARKNIQTFIGSEMKVKDTLESSYNHNYAEGYVSRVKELGFWRNEESMICAVGIEWKNKK